MDRLLLSLGIILAGLLAGYAIQLSNRRWRLVADPGLARPRRVLQIIALLVLTPVANLSAIWALNLNEIRIVFMPFLGVLTLVVGGASGILFGRALHLDRAKAGAFFTSSGMFNIGAIGALLVFVFLGEPGFALVPMFRLFEEFTYYAFGFPIARSFGVPVGAEEGEGNRLKRIFADPFILVAIGSILIGFGLNLTGVHRPDAFSRINSIVIPAASLLLLMSIGMAMRFGLVIRYLREALVVAATKYLIVPTVVVAVAIALGLGRVDGGLPLKVIVILTSVPVGFIGLVPPALYKLDVDLANASWLVTTALLVLVIPLQMLVVGLIG